jgi:hypothetical protein
MTTGFGETWAIAIGTESVVVAVGRLIARRQLGQTAFLETAAT